MARCAWCTSADESRLYDLQDEYIVEDYVGEAALHVEPSTFCSPCTPKQLRPRALKSIRGDRAYVVCTYPDAIDDVLCTYDVMEQKVIAFNVRRNGIAFGAGVRPGWECVKFEPIDPNTTWEYDSAWANGEVEFLADLRAVALTFRAGEETKDEHYAAFAIAPKALSLNRRRFFSSTGSREFEKPTTSQNLGRTARRSHSVPSVGLVVGMQTLRETWAALEHIMELDAKLQESIIAQARSFGSRRPSSSSPPSPTLPDCAFSTPLDLSSSLLSNIFGPVPTSENAELPWLPAKFGREDVANLIQFWQKTPNRPMSAAVVAHTIQRAYGILRRRPALARVCPPQLSEVQTLRVMRIITPTTLRTEPQDSESCGTVAEGQCVEALASRIVDSILWFKVRTIHEETWASGSRDALVGWTRANYLRKLQYGDPIFLGHAKKASSRKSFVGDRTSQPRMLVVGDIHGQLADVVLLFHQYGFPSKTNVYVFNGDIADRGDHAVEVFLLIFCFLILDPSSVYLNRGNHEDSSINRSDCGGFYDEILTKYGRSMGTFLFDMFGDIYKFLPLATLVSDKIFIVHGGVPRNPESTLAQLDALKLPISFANNDFITQQNQMILDLLWSDPMKEPGIRGSLRGSEISLFGPDVTLKFCHSTKVKLIVRSHQLPSEADGISLDHFHEDGELSCITVFGASNYCGVQENHGCVAIIYHNLFWSFGRYYAPAIQDISEYIKREDGDPAEEVAQESVMKLAQNVLKSAALLLLPKKHVVLAKLEAKDLVGHGDVSYSDWLNVMCEHVHPHVPWEKMAEVFSLSKVVSYQKFVNRFQLRMPTWVVREDRGEEGDRILSYSMWEEMEEGFRKIQERSDIVRVVGEDSPAPVSELVQTLRTSLFSAISPDMLRIMVCKVAALLPYRDADQMTLKMWDFLAYLTRVATTDSFVLDKRCATFRRDLISLIWHKRISTADGANGPWFKRSRDASMVTANMRQISRKQVSSADSVCRWFVQEGEADDNGTVCEGGFVRAMSQAIEGSGVVIDLQALYRALFGTKRITVLHFLDAFLDRAMHAPLPTLEYLLIAIWSKRKILKELCKQITTRRTLVRKEFSAALERLSDICANETQRNIGCSIGISGPAKDCKIDFQEFTPFSIELLADFACGPGRLEYELFLDSFQVRDINLDEAI